MAESTRTPPTAEEIGYLSSAPPTDEEGRPTPWTLSGRKISGPVWDQAIVHQGVTFHDVEFENMGWSNAVFRNCKFREVTFREGQLSKLRFEYVLFERCVFEQVRMSDTHFDRTTLGASALRFFKLDRVEFDNCQLIQLEAKVFQLRECTLSTTPIRDSKIAGLEASKIGGDALSLIGGALDKGKLTAAKLARVALEDVAVAGLEFLDCELGELSLVGGQVKDLALSSSKARSLSLTRIEKLVGLTLVESEVGELSLEACPMVAAPVVADSSVGRLRISDSNMGDAAFERVEVGAGSRIEGGALFGVMFVEGRWAGLTLANAKLERYIGVRGAHFEALALEGLTLGADWALELEGDSYGDGSMTWGDARGA